MTAITGSAGTMRPTVKVIIISPSSVVRITTKDVAILAAALGNGDFLLGGASEVWVMLMPLSLKFLSSLALGHGVPAGEPGRMPDITFHLVADGLRVGALK
ncbi:hypothetical protein AGR8A_pAt30161 [Agrobacterium fabrum str. J-07]|nr:hypothetical protein AGR8A_pAt30161 [Agrobacterium fabrum str. J-07]